MKEEDCQNMRMKAESMDAEIIELKKKVKDTSKVIETKHSDLLKSKRELKAVEENLAMTLSELENLKLERKTDSRTYNCDLCDVSAESLTQLKLHTRKDHCLNKASQCEEKINFLKYNCFYCDENLISAEDLASHPIDCHSKITTSSQACIDLNCDICAKDVKNVNDVEGHTNYEQRESDLFYCEVCPLYFRSDCDLQFHIRGCHWVP